MPPTSIAQDPRPKVHLFTDGACSGNPGPGGWAFILRHPASGAEKESSGGEPTTTNNRMELMAVIAGLTSLTRPSEVDLYSDSQYVLKGLREWLSAWKARGWRTADKKPVKNQDLWERLDAAAARHQIDWKWVKGHSGDPGNENADRLANKGLEAALLASC